MLRIHQYKHTTCTAYAVLHISQMHPRCAPTVDHLAQFSAWYQVHTYFNTCKALLNQALRVHIWQACFREWACTNCFFIFHYITLIPSSGCNRVYWLYCYKCWSHCFELVMSDFNEVRSVHHSRWRQKTAAADTHSRSIIHSAFYFDVRNFTKAFHC